MSGQIKVAAIAWSAERYDIVVYTDTDVLWRENVVQHCTNLMSKEDTTVEKSGYPLRFLTMCDVSKEIHSANTGLMCFNTRDPFIRRAIHKWDERLRAHKHYLAWDQVKSARWIEFMPHHKAHI